MKKAAPAMKTNMKKSKNRSKSGSKEGKGELSLPADRCENQGAG